MLLQGSPSDQRPIPVRTQPADNRSQQYRTAVTGPAPTAARTRDYPPITWDHPSLGKVVAQSIGGLSKSTLLLILVGGALVGTAVTIAFVITSIVSAFGINTAAGY
jgi:hypothetical protein